MNIKQKVDKYVYEDLNLENWRAVVTVMVKKWRMLDIEIY